MSTSVSLDVMYIRNKALPTNERLLQASIHIIMILRAAAETALRRSRLALVQLRHGRHELIMGCIRSTTPITTDDHWQTHAQTRSLL